MANKFFNTDLDQDEDIQDEFESEYSDKIRVTPSKAQDEYIDRSNIFVKIFLIALGSFCVLGVLYYVFEFLADK